MFPSCPRDTSACIRASARQSCAALLRDAGITFAIPWETTMRTAPLLALTALFAVHATHVEAAERSVRRGAVKTTDGGIAAGKAVGYGAANGAAGVRGHAVATDGNG